MKKKDEGKEPKKEPQQEPQQWIEVLCTNTHRFAMVRGTDARCPICEAAIERECELLPAEAFEEITDGAALWYMALSVIVGELRGLYECAAGTAAAETLMYLHQAELGAAAEFLFRWVRANLLYKDCRVIPGFEDLPCGMSEHDLAKAAVDMADLAKRLDDVEAEKKEANADFKARTESLVGALSRIGISVREGTETRRVHVDTIHDYRTGTCTRVRLDTSEVISERALEGEERQRPLFETPNLASGNGHAKSPKKKEVKKAAKSKGPRPPKRKNGKDQPEASA